MKRWILGIAALAVVGAGGWIVWHDKAPPPAPVATVPAPPPGVGALGRIEPASRVRKLNQPGGMAVTRLERLLVQEGDEVRAGQVLAEFADATMKDATVAQNRASVAEQRTALQRTREAGRASEIDAQRARIASLLAQEEIARRDASRTNRLVPSGAGSEAVAERNRFMVTRLSAEREQAEADLVTLSTARVEDVQLAEARLAAAEAALAKAEADARLSRVVAPVDGTILTIYARPGDQVGSDGLMEMADLTRLDVVADVFETDLSRLRPGALAEVVIPGENRRVRATVREIGWQVRRTTQAGTDPIAAVDSRTVEVRLTLSDEGVALLRRRTNMQVQVAIRVGDVPVAGR